MIGNIYQLLFISAEIIGQLIHQEVCKNSTKIPHLLYQVNKQDFFQVFQGSGIGKMEVNLTSADPLSYTTNGSRAG